MDSQFFKVSEDEKLNKKQLMTIFGGNGVDDDGDHSGPKPLKPTRPTDPTPPLPPFPTIPTVPPSGGK
ncbi:hypothetical protein [Flavobacterium sp.]|jgi:hypothetical protein|uniref:hypothetical protein n=1 Tax=Flavobacterium sp. TaxID=239 RepID=UPI0037C0329E